MEETQDELLERARLYLAENTPEDTSHRLLELIEQNDQWHKRTINMMAAESVMSPTAKRAIMSDLYQRNYVGQPQLGYKVHKGYKYSDQIEALLIEISKKLFRCKFAECRPVSSSTAEALVMHCLTQVGDAIVCLQKGKGHGTWNSATGYNDMRGLSVVELPFDFNEWNIDLDGLARIPEMVKKSPLIIIGTSVMLFPHPCKEVRKVADEIGAKVWYDAAHPLGLIAGGRFQAPLNEGVDVIVGSQQKSLSGPIGGMILTNDRQIDEKIKNYYLGHFSIYGHGRLAALAITLTEWLKYGNDFAAQIIANAKALGKALDDEGFDVVAKHKGYTESHTILVDAKSLGGGHKAAAQLEKANILLSAFKLWDVKEDFQGLRLGTTEMTRYGMKEPEMRTIAEFMRRVIIDEEDPEKVRNQITEFRTTFDRVHYCFENP